MNKQSDFSFPKMKEDINLQRWLSYGIIEYTKFKGGVTHVRTSSFAL